MLLSRKEHSMANQKNDLEFVWSRKNYRACSLTSQLVFCYLSSATGHSVGLLPGLISTSYLFDRHELNLDLMELGRSLDELKANRLIAYWDHGIYISDVVSRPQSQPTRCKYLPDWKFEFDSITSTVKDQWLSELGSACCDWPARFHQAALKIFWNEDTQPAASLQFGSKEALRECTDIVATFAAEYERSYKLGFVPLWKTETRHIASVMRQGMSKNDIIARIPVYFEFLRRNQRKAPAGMYGFLRNINLIKPVGPVQTTEQASDYDEILTKLKSKFARQAGAA
jgi:hypothetical protein